MGAFAPLILKGNLKVNGADVSEQVTSFKFTAARATVEKPATFGSRKSFGGGEDTYNCELAYLQDTASEALTRIFWTAIASEPGTVTVEGTIRDAPVGPDNPVWEAEVLVTGAGAGGDVNTYGVDTQTFPCLDRPTLRTTDS